MPAAMELKYRVIACTYWGWARGCTCRDEESPRVCWCLKELPSLIGQKNGTYVSGGESFCRFSSFVSSVLEVWRGLRVEEKCFYF
ncbi:hypothetical protein NPIL_496431 [Nephila pilipes]|uniref:Uncharacterized protein n=1 Tax=Nephila pilipes TaxID=299642 RepID=A0A8X6NR46_NEPPI|nr:hypothetical protein NPIL_496431 [Nephila pilipes]